MYRYILARVPTKGVEPGTGSVPFLDHSKKVFQVPSLKLREVKKQGWQQFFWLLASRSAFWKLVFLADSSETKLPASKPYFLKRAASQKIKLLA